MNPIQKKVIATEHAPKPIGPYSAGIHAGNFIFTAGQVGIDPQTGEIVPGGIEAETRQVLTNVKNILAETGAGLEQVVKTTVFMRDMNEFSRMNAVYAEFFPQDPPARSTFGVVALPKNAAVEIEVVAIIQ
jgi:2-iminobutanoate/2-iminopropanoate deaminase